MSDWPLEKRQRRALNRRIDLLRRVDRRLAEDSIVIKMKAPEIYKIRVQGNVQLRPRLCFGPQDPEQTITLLQRVVKKDNVERPADASARARAKRGEVAADSTRRQFIEEGG